jgi:hypothetical protein
MEQNKFIRVRDYWNNSPSSLLWQEWKSTHEDLGLLENVDSGPWKDEETLLRIHIKHGPDILRWGYSSRGVFSIKESYGLKSNFHLLPKDNI